MEKISLPEHWIKWEIKEEIGAGAYGRVYRVEASDTRGHDPEISAVKIIRIPADDSEAKLLFRESGSMEEVSAYYSTLVSGLVDEIQTLMTLKGCRNIVQIQDYHVERTPENEYGWIIYIRMEYLQSLSDYLLKHVMDETEVIQMGIDLCCALEECEKAGIIHRDIKPDNILVSAEGEYRLGDFGVAKRLSESSMSFSIKGTYSYMSPEVYFGRPYDQRSDIYSLGLVLYKMLNHNREPFVDLEKQIIIPRDKSMAMNLRMRGEPFPNPVEASPEMSEIILKASSFLPEDRYTSALLLKEDLIRLKKGTYGKKRGIRQTVTSLKEKKTDKKSKKTGDKGNRGSDQGKLSRSESLGHRLPWIAAGIFICLIAAVMAAGGSRLKLIHTGNEEAKLLLDQVPCSRDEKVVCSLDQSGTLTILGEGAVEASEITGTYPWENYRNEIKELIIKEGISSIDDYAFDGCVYLEKVVLPDGLKRLGESAFENCVEVEISHFPESLEQIDFNALKDTGWLSHQISDNDFVILNGILLSYSGEAEKLTIPKEVKEISYNAFEGNTILRTVILPEKLTCIQDNAFYSCTNLKEVLNLEGNEHISQIGFDAFEDTAWLKNLEARGGGFAILDKRLFSYGGKEKHVVIPDHVEEILGAAFAQNRYIEYIEVPKSVGRIGEQVFYHCPRLQEVVFKDSPIKEIPVWTFSDCVSLKEITLPDQVTAIGESAFENCGTLRKVVLPARIESIEINSFDGCGNLEEVEGEANLPASMVESVFAGTPWYENDYQTRP